MSINDKCYQSTDKELWRTVEGDYYSKHKLYLTESGGLTLCQGGTCITLPPEDWFKLANQRFKTEQPVEWWKPLWRLALAVANAPHGTSFKLSAEEIIKETEALCRTMPKRESVNEDDLAAFLSINNYIYNEDADRCAKDLIENFDITTSIEDQEGK